MTSYIMYDILKLSVFWKIWRRRGLTLFLGGGVLGWPWSSSDVHHNDHYKTIHKTTMLALP